jgi:hypothetical protein
MALRAGTARQGAGFSVGNVAGQIRVELEIP